LTASKTTTVQAAKSATERVSLNGFTRQLFAQTIGPFEDLGFVEAQNVRLAGERHVDSLLPHGQSGGLAAPDGRLFEQGCEFYCLHHSQVLGTEHDHRVWGSRVETVSFSCEVPHPFAHLGFGHDL
jgi:hypothetical protein